MNGKRKNSGSDRYFSNLTLGHAEPIAVFPLVFSVQGLYNRGRIM